MPYPSAKGLSLIYDIGRQVILDMERGVASAGTLGVRNAVIACLTRANGDVLRRLSAVCW